MADRKFKLNTTPAKMLLYISRFHDKSIFSIFAVWQCLKSLGHRKKHDDKQLCVATACDLIDHRANQNVCVFSA